MEDSDLANVASPVERIRSRIRTLTDEQNKAIQRAVYVRMTADEARAYDERRELIRELFERLTQLAPYSRFRSHCE